MRTSKTLRLLKVVQILVWAHNIYSNSAEGPTRIKYWKIYNNLRRYTIKLLTRGI